MTDDELALHRESINWIKSHADDIYQSLTQNKTFDSNQKPAATFMAGTPGAGKTEFSKRFIENFTERPLRVDTDELREDT